MPLAAGHSTNLRESGWGVIFARDVDPAIRKALVELLDHRRAEATWHSEHRYRELVYWPGERQDQFLARYGARPGPADPEQLPYYLLLVGGPEAIPYRFQIQLGVQRAVGRIHFDTPQAYANYARSVVSFETQGFEQPRRAVFFAAEHPGDVFAAWSARGLMAPLAERLSGEHADWAIQAILGEGATKARLGTLFASSESPALLVAAGHGLGFPPGDPRYAAHQGALLCADWPGPGTGPIPSDLYFSADDVDPSASLLGLVTLHLASYSAGTPGQDGSARQALEDCVDLAPQSSVAALPQRLLAHPRGGVLAFVGQVGRLWGHTSDQGLGTYYEALKRLLDGQPIGHALDPFGLKHAEASSALSNELEDIAFGAPPDDFRLFDLWAAAQDLGNALLLGDPGVRLVAKGAKDAVGERPAIRPVVLEPEPMPEPARVGIRHPYDNLAEAGWGAIFPYEDPLTEPRVPAIWEALQPLLDRRRAQAGERFRIFVGADGCRPGETAREFLTRHGVGLGAVTPEKVPFYLLLVADPEAIPYEFQYQLDVRYAVGRIHFDTVDEHAHYARSVVAAETGEAVLPRRITFFGVQNPDDRATQVGLNYLVKPLAEELAEAHRDWVVETVLREEATKARLRGLLGGENTPAMLFTASQGVTLPSDDPRQLAHNGALVCQDWPGPKEWRGLISPDLYFAGDDLPADANLLGRLAFFFSSSTAGTPRLDNFAAQAFKQTQPIAPHAFVARLPQRLLGHPRGGALAVVGHVERAWGSSFIDEDGKSSSVDTFLHTLTRLLEGYPVGLAMEHFNARYAQLATEWAAQQTEVFEGGKEANAYKSARLLTSAIDTRNYVIVGDPAARLAARAEPEAAAEARAVEPSGRRGAPASITFEAHDPAPLADLSRVGWGVIFPAEKEPSHWGPTKKALKHLLDLRQYQAGPYFKVYEGKDGHRPGETAREFLARHGIGSLSWPVTPDKVPYYLLLVGDPEAIPYEFQYQLDVRYAVGRIHFDTVEEYAHYARSVVAAETGEAALPRRVTFFGVQNPGDRATELGANYLVKPLAEQLAEAHRDWVVETVLREEATKAHLRGLLGGENSPALLFTASHGLGFPNGDPHQLAHQGALLCQDWPGPSEWRGPITPDLYFAGDDVAPDADLLGRLAFFFADYGAGTPRLGNFAAQAFKQPQPIAPHAFVARLPQRLLGHPQGGALAVVGHVERAWGYSFIMDRGLPSVDTFLHTLTRLLEGCPVGLAMEHFNARYARLATEWVDHSMREQAGEEVDDLRFAAMQTAIVDARNYVIVGDPAVRLPEPTF